MILSSCSRCAGSGPPVGDDPGAEPAWRRALAPALDAPLEDQRDLVRAAEVEVVADDLLEEDPPGGRPAQDLGEGELGPQDRQFVAVVRGDVADGERMQFAQPFAQQGIDIGRAGAVADGLRRRRVPGGEPVIQRLEADPGPGGLPLSPFMAVDPLRCRADYAEPSELPGSGLAEVVPGLSVLCA